jgi:hypothetical protein
LLFASWLLHALLTTNILYPTVGQTVCSHPRDSDSLLVTQTLGLPSYSNHLSLALYSCYLMKLLYNMIFLPSDAHSDVINQHCRALLVLCRALIVILLMISGNVNVLLLTPILICALISASLISALIKALGFLHFNTRSLLPKMYQLKVWVHSSNPDVLVITETWLRNSVLNTDVNLSGYNLFGQDRSSKGGGVAIFTRDHLQCSVVSTKSVLKQFDLLVLSITLSNSSLLTVSGRYRPPSSPACTLPALSSLLAPYTKSEFVLLGDLNWDMFKSPDQVLKQWDSLNFSQVSTNPTRYDSKHPEKATLLTHPQPHK